jgi:hypothetical protein
MTRAATKLSHDACCHKVPQIKLSGSDMPWTEHIGACESAAVSRVHGMARPGPAARYLPVAPKRRPTPGTNRHQTTRKLSSRNVHGPMGRQLIPMAMDCGARWSLPLLLGGGDCIVWCISRQSSRVPFWYCPHFEPRTSWHNLLRPRNDMRNRVTHVEPAQSCDLGAVVHHWGRINAHWFYRIYRTSFFGQKSAVGWRHANGSQRGWCAHTLTKPPRRGRCASSWFHGRVLRGVDHVGSWGQHQRGPRAHLAPGDHDVYAATAR